MILWRACRRFGWNNFSQETSASSVRRSPALWPYHGTGNIERRTSKEFPLYPEAPHPGPLLARRGEGDECAREVFDLSFLYALKLLRLSGRSWILRLRHGLLQFFTRPGIPLLKFASEFVRVALGFDFDRMER